MRNLIYVETWQKEMEFQGLEMPYPYVTIGWRVRYSPAIGLIFHSRSIRLFLYRRVLTFTLER